MAIVFTDLDDLRRDWLYQMNVKDSEVNRLRDLIERFDNRGSLSGSQQVDVEREMRLRNGKTAVRLQAAALGAEIAQLRYYISAIVGEDEGWDVTYVLDENVDPKGYMRKEKTRS
jgi:hypothetical protein